MSILIDKIRIKNFRSLQNVETDLCPVTVLVGTNNAGKTTFLKALNTVLGTSRTQLNSDDLFIDQAGNQPERQIKIDIRIVPVDDQGNRQQRFEDNEYGLFGGQDLVQSDKDGKYLGFEFYAFRSIFEFEKNGDTPGKTRYASITDWGERRQCGRIRR